MANDLIEIVHPLRFFPENLENIRNTSEQRHIILRNMESK